MSLRGLLLVGLAAALTAIANLLLRGGLIRGGGLSFVRADVLGQALSLLGEPMFVAGVVFYGAYSTSHMGETVPIEINQSKASES